jgi:trehalose 6-phosphate synthase/phosphatase
LLSDWKDTIRPVLELYSDRTPGSSVEEKDFSLVWHYRRADPELASIRIQELRDAVLNLTENLDIGVFEGSKILEVKNIGVSKGHAAERWLAKSKRGFILAAGDDYTDEDMFSILPETAYSVKVGYGISKARFNVESVYELRLLLEELVKTKSLLRR